MDAYQDTAPDLDASMIGPFDFGDTSVQLPSGEAMMQQDGSGVVDWPSGTIGFEENLRAYHLPLERHKNTLHSPGKVVCSKPLCNTVVKWKDKLRHHMLTRHGDFECELPHCERGPGNGFPTKTHLDCHQKNDHGPYRCALGACTQQPLSKLASSSLRTHLRKEHGLDWYQSFDTWNVLHDYTVRDVHFSTPFKAEREICE